MNRTIQLHLAATHFPECSAQEMRGLEIRWKQNLEKRRKEEEEVTCRRLLWCVCVLRRSIFIDFMRWLWITNYSENCFQGEHKPASYFDHQGTEVPGF